MRNEVTVRQILSMTSGYQDYWPQDYVMPPMMKPVDAQAILDEWARKPLDFEPGTRWQYSNTNYVIAGLIVEKASGIPLLDFLAKRVFGPLGMTSVTDTDSAPLGPNDPERYLRYALGSPRPAPKEGKGWLFAAGELAMTAEDLARWDISMIEQAVLRPASYREMQTEVRLVNGVGTRYGLGVSVTSTNGRRAIAHGGEVSGFTAQNQVYPGRSRSGRRSRQPRRLKCVGSNRHACLGAALRFDARGRPAYARAGAVGVPVAAAGQDRPVALHGKCERVFQRHGAERFRRQPRTAGPANRFHRAVTLAPWRHDVCRLSDPLRADDNRRDHVRHVRGTPGTISGRAAGLDRCPSTVLGSPAARCRWSEGRRPSARSDRTRATRRRWRVPAALSGYLRMGSSQAASRSPRVIDATALWA